MKYAKQQIWGLETVAFLSNWDLLLKHLKMKCVCHGMFSNKPDKAVTILMKIVVQGLFQICRPAIWESSELG